MFAHLLDWLFGHPCSTCSQRIRSDRVSLHYYVEHAGELGLD